VRDEIMSRPPHSFQGIVAAPHTPFLPDLSLDLRAVERQARFLRDGGVNGVFIGGSTGEGPSLTLTERRELTRRWVEVARGTSLGVLVHVGSNCLPDACELAAQAQQCGADAISTMAPYYFKPASVAELVDFCAPIAAAAPELPFYYYDYPAMTGVRLPITDFLLQGRERIPTLAGAKCSNGDLTQLQHCLRAGDGMFNILLGCDELLLAGLALGVRGAVGTTFNVAAPLYQRIFTAFREGNLAAAQTAQWQSARMVQILAAYGLVPASKAMMRMLGVDCGPVRPPLRNLTANELEALERELVALEVLKPGP
jgi:N-acetylneuraminate lyase